MEPILLPFCPAEFRVARNSLIRNGASKTPGERIIRGFNAGFGQGIEESGFADVRQADDAALERHEIPCNKVMAILTLR